jgi:hypothetical protein
MPAIQILADEIVNYFEHFFAPSAARKSAQVESSVVNL